MKQMRRFGLILPVISMVFASLACNMPAITSESEADAAATATMQAMATFVAQTLEPGELDQNAESDESESSEPPAPTPSPTPSPTPTPTATITPTDTPPPPIVSVSIDTNCRFGPGDVYEYLGALLVGESSEVVGKNSSETFWYIQNPDPPPEFCWIWGHYAAIEGDTSQLPVLTPPPTPTPSPVPFAFHAEYGDLIPCGAYAFFVRIKNTGGMDIESLDLKVVDTTINLTQTHVNDIFGTSLTCTPSSTPRLEPGEVGYTFVSGFQTISNHTFKATIKVCSEDGLGGTCEVQQFSVTE
jgi:hypothetical protein